MEVTVVKKSNIGTTPAKIVTKHTKANATAFCREYVQKVTPKCIADELKVELMPEISANCKTGKITTLNGQGYQFLGPNADYDPTGMSTEYLLVEVGSNEPLDASSASGYDGYARTGCRDGSPLSALVSAPHPTASPNPLANILGGRGADSPLVIQSIQLKRPLLGTVKDGDDFDGFGFHPVGHDVGNVGKDIFPRTLDAAGTAHHRMAREIVHRRDDARHDAGGRLWVVFRDVGTDLVESPNSSARPAQRLATHALRAVLTYFATTLASSLALANSPRSASSTPARISASCHSSRAT